MYVINILTFLTLIFLTIESNVFKRITFIHQPRFHLVFFFAYKILNKHDIGEIYK